MNTSTEYPIPSNAELSIAQPRQHDISVMSDVTDILSINNFA